MTRPLKKKRTPLKKQVSFVVNADDTQSCEEVVKDVQRMFGDKYKSLAITACVSFEGKTYSDMDFDWDAYKPKPGAVAYGDQRAKNVEALGADTKYKGISFTPARSGGKIKQQTIAESAAIVNARKQADRDAEAALAKPPRKLLRKSGGNGATTPPLPKMSMDDIDAAATKSSSAKTEEVKRRLLKKKGT